MFYKYRIKIVILITFFNIFYQHSYPHFVMSHSISEIVDTIQYKTKQSLERIAENIGYSRPHLNKAKLSNEGENVKEALLKHYKEILQKGFIYMSNPRVRLSFYYIHR